MTGQQLNLDEHLTLRQVEALPPVMQWRKLLAHVSPPPGKVSVASFRSVGHVLANHADRLGGSVRPSVETIAAEAGVSRRSAVYALRALEDAGLRGYLAWPPDARDDPPPSRLSPACGQLCGQRGERPRKGCK